jgi:16S rRNA (cytosine967-C5)-methyltransferase
LRIGLYQLFWLDRVPNHAAVHETVEAAKRLGFGAQSGFLNAILRGYTREEEGTRRELEDWRRNQPALGYSHPDWLWERWQQRWGTERAVKLLEWNNSPPPTYARANPLKPADLPAQWNAEGVQFSPRDWDWAEPGLMFQLDSHPPLTSLPSFQQGLYYVQDPSTLFSVSELDPQPGETILDLCSAPGGKTTYMAQRMQNRGSIVAEDIQPERLQMVRDNCRRLGVVCVHTSAGRPAKQGSLSERFDRILIDAPCSNTGVLRRRVELRWRIRPEEIDRLKRTQAELLRQAAERLKPGGILVYSTCSLEPEENREVVAEFLRDQPLEFLQERELLPFSDGVDGAYTAKLRSV